MNNTVCINENVKVSVVVTIIYFLMINVAHDLLILKRGLSFDDHANYCMMKYTQMFCFSILFVVVQVLGHINIDCSIIVFVIVGFIYSVNTLINYILQIILNSQYIDTDDSEHALIPEV